jgi:hypothetical protein
MVSASPRSGAATVANSGSFSIDGPKLCSVTASAPQARKAQAGAADRDPGRDARRCVLLGGRISVFPWFTRVVPSYADRQV